MQRTGFVDRASMMHTCAVLAGFIAIVMAPCLSAYRLFYLSGREGDID